MISRLQDHLTTSLGIKKDDKILLAVSGGLDSVVMAHLFARLEQYDFAIAHCNYQLRGEESEDDEIFIKDLAASLGVPFFFVKFNTKSFAKEQKLSIQEAARNLRYTWLENMRIKHGFDYIATAHHLNDSVETILYNLSKGSGIRGLHGIPLKNGRVIRPLLFATRTDIAAYAKEHFISYREDSSNKTTKYARNIIRLNVVPELEKINPDFVNGIAATIRRLQDTEKLFDWALAEITATITGHKKEGFFISKQLLNNYPAPGTILYEILKKYDFNASQVTTLMSNPAVGGQLLSSTHCLLIDRDSYLVQPIEQDVRVTYQIEKNDGVLLLPEYELSVREELSLETPDFQDTRTAYFDAAKITFPLTVRPWQPGDVFQPYGMSGKHKKVQDLLTDMKLSLFEKRKVWIIENGGYICWVVGFRTDERFKIDYGTIKCLVISIKDY